MNPEELKHAAEVMLRASQGELVEWTDHGRTDWKLEIRGVEKILWDFHAYAYRILDFPDPPQGQKWFNPSNLTATQVGVHEGWRLLLEGESIHRGDEFWDGWRAGSPSDQRWNKTSCGGVPIVTGTHFTHRTKSPLPEVKADSFEAAWPEIERGEREFMMSLKGTVICTDNRISKAMARIAWQACEKHHLNQKEGAFLT